MAVGSAVPRTWCTWGLVSREAAGTSRQQHDDDSTCRDRRARHIGKCALQRVLFPLMLERRLHCSIVEDGRSSPVVHKEHAILQNICWRMLAGHAVPAT